MDAQKRFRITLTQEWPKIKNDMQKHMCRNDRRRNQDDLESLLEHTDATMKPRPSLQHTASTTETEVTAVIHCHSNGNRDQ
jgi:hypothetical protein